MDRNKMIALGIAGAMIYISVAGKVRNAQLKTAMLAVGSIVVLKNAPVVSGIAGSYV